MIFLTPDNLKMGGYVYKRTPSLLVSPLGMTNPGLPYLRENALVGEFRGVNCFLEYLQDDMAVPMHDKSSTSFEKGFNFFETYEEAMECYLNNPSAVRHFTEKDEQLEGGDAAGKHVEYGVTGDFLDIGRFVEGDPESFGQMTEGNPRNKRVQICINLGWWCGVKEDVINVRCSRIARLIDWLESQQIRCRVVGVSSTECSHIEIAVKDFDEGLDLNDIAVISHSDFLRRCRFRFDEWSETWQWGYGSSINFSESIKPSLIEPEYSSEFSVFVDSRITESYQVNNGFDSLEKWFEENISNDTLAPEERTKIILG